MANEVDEGENLNKEELEGRTSESV